MDRSDRFDDNLMSNRPRHRRKESKEHGCELFTSLVVVFFCIAVTLVVMGLLVYILVRPKSPRMSIVDAALFQSNAGAAAAAAPQTSTILFNLSNPNKKLSMVYYGMKLEAFVVGTKIAEVPGDGKFSQPKGASSLFDASFPLLGDGALILDASGVDVYVRFRMQVAYDLGLLRFPRFKFKAKCRARVIPNSPLRGGNEGGANILADAYCTSDLGM